MNIKAAVRAAAAGAAARATEALALLDPTSPALATPLRAAHLIGQCAHESMGFTRLVESLYFTTPERLMAVWPRRFASLAVAAGFTRDPERLANHVYGGRMGNTRPGDGYRYRGRGYLQLTGRTNYRRFGARIGIDLEAGPERAAEPEIAWLIAASYLATRSRGGKTALEWADTDNVETVTRIVNGGLNGLADRRQRTAAALSALAGMGLTLRRGDEGPEVLLLQRALAAHGFTPGALDGDFGPRTEAALIAFQRQTGLTADGRAGPDTRAALMPLAA